MLKYLWFFIVIAIAASTLRTIWLSLRSRQFLTQQERRVEQLEEETSALEEKVREATASFTLEKRAREELGLHKDGETVIKLEP